MYHLKSTTSQMPAVGQAGYRYVDNVLNKECLWDSGVYVCWDPQSGMTADQMIKKFTVSVSSDTFIDIPDGYYLAGLIIKNETSDAMMFRVETATEEADIIASFYIEANFDNRIADAGILKSRFPDGSKMYFASMGGYNGCVLTISLTFIKI